LGNNLLALPNCGTLEPMKQFVQIGRYRINVSAIAALVTGKEGERARIYTTAIGLDGKPLTVLLSEEQAVAVKRALDKYTTVLLPD